MGWALLDLPRCLAKFPNFKHLQITEFIVALANSSDYENDVLCNMSKTRASALSRVPNTEKQMKARGRRPSAFICFEVFGTRDKARSPSF